jgi:predicted transcriptional regulator
MSKGGMELEYCQLLICLNKATHTMKLHNILQTEDIIKVSSDDTLSLALNKLSSSHDAAFVFDNDKYMGVVNPYYCVIKTSSPSNAKLVHCLYHAPHVKLNFPVSKIAQLMIESKIHYLPVFDDNDKFAGIVTARGLLRALEYLDIFMTKSRFSRKKLPLIMVFEDDALAVALQKFKSSRVSKLVVVNKEMRLKGILSYYDLISYLASPKKKDRSDRGHDKPGLQNKSVRHFLKTMVLTLNKEDYLRDALHLILEKKIGSVVIIDAQNHPISIITTKDLLSLFVRESTKEKIELTSKNLSKESRRTLGGFFEHLKLSLK